MSWKDIQPEWPEPGWEGHRKQQLQDAHRYSTPEERLQWLEDMLELLQLPLKDDFWTPESKG